MKTKEEYLKAVDELMDSYDAFYVMNKYGELDKNTHGTQLSMLYELLNNDDMAMLALYWIQYSYDCFYKEEVEGNADNPFNYLREQISKKFLEAEE